MLGQGSEVELDQIRLHMLDDAIAHVGRQQINDGGMNRCGGRERPTVPAILLHELRNVIGQLLEDAALRFGFDSLMLRGGTGVSPVAAVVESSGEISDLVLESAVRIGDETTGKFGYSAR